MTDQGSTSTPASEKLVSEVAGILLLMTRYGKHSIPSHGLNAQQPSPFWKRKTALQAFGCRPANSEEALAP